MSRTPLQRTRDPLVREILEIQESVLMLQERNAELNKQKHELLCALEFLAAQWADDLDNDKPINGADFVEWFHDCLNLTIRPALARARAS